MNPSAAADAIPRILIVDDDPGTVRLLIDVVKGMGQVRFATGGAEAIDTALAFRPDIVLLDIEMPESDGIEVCERLKADMNFEDVPILFVTAHHEVDIEARALAAGAIDFVTKPPSPPVVQARVRNYLALKQRTDELRRLTTVDGLTGIANRRAFDAALDLEWRRACRTGEALVLLMVDIDHFKQYNDTYGHQTGDACLRAVSEVLSGIAKRPGELAARYGGEEFAVLLPGCSGEQALQLAEAARRRAAALGETHTGTTALPSATLSVGIGGFAAVCRGYRRQPREPGRCRFQSDCPLGPADLIEAADRALYAAKQAGRNRVEVSPLP